MVFPSVFGTLASRCFLGQDSFSVDFRCLVSFAVGVLLHGCLSLVYAALSGVCCIISHVSVAMVLVFPVRFLPMSKLFRVWFYFVLP